MHRDTLICDRCGKPAHELIEFNDGGNTEELDRRCLLVRLNEATDLVSVTMQRREQPVAKVARMRR